MRHSDPRSDQRRLARSAGYSVLEFMVVMAILGALLATAVPSLVQLVASVSMSGAVRQVGMDLELARMQAIAQATRFQVVFDTMGNGYEIQREVAPDAFVSEGGRRTVPFPVRLTSAYPEAVIFNTWGRPSTPAQVQLADGSGRSSVVAINALGHIYQP